MTSTETIDAQQRAQELAPVLAAFPVVAGPLVSAAAACAGLSGARVWRLSAANGLEYCLRAWPAEHPTPPRLRAIHALVRHVYAAGLVCLAPPLPSRSGATFIEHRGRLWELSPWLSGRAFPREAWTAAMLTEAVRTLAQFHVAASRYDGPAFPEPGRPGIWERLEQLRNGADPRYLAQLRAAVQHDCSSVDPGLALSILSLVGRVIVPVGQTVARGLAELPEHVAPAASIPCLRDVKCDHVLFTDGKVRGIIDYGALRPDHVAADLSRLLGSVVPDNPSRWDAALADYAEVWPLNDADREWVRLYDLSAIVLGGLQWLNWLYVERRSFADHAAVACRLREYETRLASLVDRLGVAVVG